MPMKTNVVLTFPFCSFCIVPKNIFYISDSEYSDIALQVLSLCTDNSPSACKHKAAFQFWAFAVQSMIYQKQETQLSPRDCATCRVS